MSIKGSENLNLEPQIWTFLKLELFLLKSKLVFLLF